MDKSGKDGNHGDSSIYAVGICIVVAIGLLVAPIVGICASIFSEYQRENFYIRNCISDIFDVLLCGVKRIEKNTERRRQTTGFNL